HKEPPAGAVGVDDRGGRHQRMDTGAVFTDQIDLKDFVHVPAQVLQILSKASGARLIDERGDRQSYDLSDRVADDIGHSLVGKDRDTLSVDQPDAFVEVLDEEPVPVLALPQDLLYPPLF